MIKGLRSIILLALTSVALIACSAEESSDSNAADAGQETTAAVKAQTPAEAYAQLVAAVKTKDYGAMYDLMDSANRNYTNMWFDLNLRQLDVMDSAERAGWEQFKNISDPRTRFQRLVEVTPLMRERFIGGYKVLEADTVVAVVTQHSGHPRQITYFRYEDGGYKYTAPPESKMAPAAVRRPQSVAPPAE